jgi:hypothetical protein
MSEDLKQEEGDTSSKASLPDASHFKLLQLIPEPE